MSSLYLEGISVSEMEALIKKTVEEVLTAHLKEHFSTYYTKDHFRLPKEKLLLTRNETAQLLGVSLVTLHAWTLAGRFTAYRIGTRIRYKADEINSALIQIKTSKFKKNGSKEG